MPKRFVVDVTRKCGSFPCVRDTHTDKMIVRIGQAVDAPHATDLAEVIAGMLNVGVNLAASEDAS